MSKALVIKQKSLGEGKPIICVPIMKEKAKEIREEAVRLCQEKVDMLEWRVDYFCDYKDCEAVCDLLRDLQGICAKSILLVTYRSHMQGGQGKLDPKGYQKLLLEIAQCKAADLIDLEYFHGKNLEQELALSLKKEGARLLVSHHDFHKTPSAMDLISTLLTMEESGADLVKIAVMPEHKGDVLHLLEASLTFTEHSKTPLVSMAMGHLGTISRLGGELFGSCITFASMGQASAPGQLPYAEVEQVLGILHENMREGNG